MRRKFSAFYIVCLVCLLIPVQAIGTSPITRIIYGCVIDGMLFQGMADDSRIASKVYTILVEPSLDLTPYEGKKIYMEGRMLSGIFYLDLDKGIEVLGACNKEQLPAIRKELQWAYRENAQAMADRNDWSNAWKYLDKAIELDGTNCTLYLTKSRFYKKQGKVEEAVKEAQRAVDYGCNRYPEWVFLAELLEKVGKISAAIDAYAKAVGVCGYKPDRDKFLQKIEQLGGSTDNIPLGEDGGKEF
jgi:tetratricopeptide (TPR) repeat protein